VSPGRAAGVAGAAMVLAAAAFGCGFGPGPSSGGTATLTVTRDYGSERLANADDADPPSSETVMRLLDRETEVTTRYGGGFVQSINGIAGSLEGGRSFDWFFYVNGIESPVGATDAPVRGGDRIWWDYHDWTAASRAPAVVGSFPEPLAQRSADDPMPVLIECAGAGHACGETTDRLDAAGIDASVSHGIMPGGGDELRVLVGPWGALRADPAAAQLERGPATSGVFAEPQRVGGGWVLPGWSPPCATARIPPRGWSRAPARRGSSGPLRRSTRRICAIATPSRPLGVERCRFP
jgi:Domain of unknown function (DUF4430)